MSCPGGLRLARRPSTLAEARQMRDYNERIIATSGSPQRVERATRMLETLAPELERLEIVAPVAAATAPRRSSDDQYEYETVWNGEVGLCSDGLGSSLGGRQFDVSIRRG